jgi:cleavage and polyadenylation specificity factor subunit 1
MLVQIYALPDLGSPIYVAEGLSFVPPTISPQYTARRSTAKETLTEILVADLGDATSRSTYLIVSPHLPEVEYLLIHNRFEQQVMI